VVTDLDRRGNVAASVRTALCRPLRRAMAMMACLLCAGGPAYGEVSAHLVFRHVLVDQVESIGYVRDIVQDATGFMWFAGANGLARYDGYELRVYRNDPQDPTSLPSNYLNDLLVAQNGELWIGSRAGLHRYDAERDHFVHFSYGEDAQEAEAVNDVNFLWQDRQQRFWLATRGGLLEFLPEEASFRRIPPETYSPRGGSAAIWTIAEDATGHLWLGQQTGGACRFHPDKNTATCYRHAAADAHSLSADDVRKIYVDRRNRVWLGTYGRGLNRYDPSRDYFVRYAHEQSEKGGVIWDILEDQDGQMWVGDGQGVSLLDEASGRFTSFRYQEGQPETPGNYAVTRLFEDRAGDIWLGFFPSGVDMVDARASVFRNYRHEPQNPNSITDGGVIAAFEDSRGNLWIGTGLGLSYFDRYNGQFTRIKHVPGDTSTPSGSTTLSVIEDHEGVLWLGVWSSGLNRRDPVTGQYIYYRPDPDTPNSLWGREPWDVYEDSRHDIWIATELGLNRYNRATDDFTRYLPPADMIGEETTLYSRVIYEDSHDNLWWGTARGLFLLDRDSGTFTAHYHHDANDPRGMAADFVTALYEDRYGHLWVGSQGGGVSVMDDETRTFRTFTVADGLADDTVSGIQGDREGFVWLSTRKGLSRFDPVTQTFRNFDKRHGLSGNLFNRNTPLLTRRGELLFGNSKGFFLFDPAQLTDNDYVPPVVLTDFQIANRSVTVAEQESPLRSSISTARHITLDHTQPAFSLTYAALNYRASEDNQYAYRLVGFDRDWNEVGNRRLATYTNLDPGEYFFEVRGANNDGVWNREGQGLRITILPPLWRTWWAYTLYCAVLALLVAGWIYSQKRKVAAERHKVEQERAVVKALKEADRRKDEILANTSHELRTPLNGMIGLAQTLMDGISGPVNESARWNLQLIVTSGRRLATLVDEILDSAKRKNAGVKLHRREVDLRVLVDGVQALTQPLLGSKPVKLHNAVPEQLLVYADEDRLQQILHNLLGNAAKFVDSGSITVTAQWRGGEVEVAVSDTGVGIPAEQLDTIFESFQQGQGPVARECGGTGLGLSVSRQLVELHGGRLMVNSQVGQGTTFTFTLPLTAPEAQPMTLLKEFTEVFPDPSVAADDQAEPFSEPGRQVHEHSHGEGAHLHNEGAHILIIDDEPVNLTVLHNILVLHDFRVTQADQGLQALAEVEKGDVDLVILDVMMPRLSGYDTCRQIRQKFTAQELPIILLTARTRTEDLLAGFEAGANDYLTKPVDKEELLVRVYAHLRHLEMHRLLDKKVAERTFELHAETKRLQETQEDLQQAYRRLEEHSVTDPLTGLKNRRFLTQNIDRDIQFVAEQYRLWLHQPHSRPRNHDLVFVLLDVDFFKRVNDSHGHGIGDRLLEQLAALLQKAMRESDYLVRWSGEEFLVVARATAWREAADLVERLRVTIERHPFRLGPDLVLHITCSFGFAAYPFFPLYPTAFNWEQVVDRADQALYVAKRSGRNAWVGLRGAPAGNPEEEHDLSIKEQIQRGNWVCVSSQEVKNLRWD
jgi:two-component system sensor histidine kinase ChiS